MRRIEILLGKQVTQVDAGDLAALIAGSAREDADLDFKEQVYGTTDADKRDLAGDVAAMANTVGGVIVVGVREEDGAASKETPVPLTENEELRMRQVVTSLVAPVPRFTVVRVPEAPNAEIGFYLIAVPRSADSPHAVRVGDALRYPRRDGPRTRLLSESEVADAYRNRFSEAGEQTQRLEQIANEGQNALELNETVWFGIGLVPLSPGSLEIRQRTIRDAQANWIGPWAQNQGFGSAVFHSGAFDVSAGVRRVIISAGRNRGEWVSRWGHAELYQNGSGYAAVPLWRVTSDSPDEVRINDEHLVSSALSATGMLVDHATRRCGAFGDAIAISRIVTAGTRWCSLAHWRFGYLADYHGGRRLHSFPESRHQISLDDCQTGNGLVLATRMVLTELIQAVGTAEVLQISPNGELRRPYFVHERLPAVEAWAKANGVVLIDSKID